MSMCKTNAAKTLNFKTYPVYKLRSMKRKLNKNKSKQKAQLEN